MKRIFIIIILILLGASKVLASDTLEVYLVKVLKYRDNQFAYYVCHLNQETNNFTKTGNYNDLMTIKGNIKKLLYHNPLIINSSETQHITKNL